MAIRMRMRWDGVTPEQYDEVRELVGWERDRPTGGVLHEAWFVDDQLNVCDVWESAEDCDNFVQQRLMPGVTQLRIPGQPEVEILPAYHWQLEKPGIKGAVVEEEVALPIDAYKALEAKVGWRDVPPVGGISHVAAVDGDMVRAVTVWESRADHDAFVEGRVGSAAAELGFPEPEEETVFAPLHALYDAAGVLTS